jgi:hypothetical protein
MGMFEQNRTVNKRKGLKCPQTGCTQTITVDDIYVSCGRCQSRNQSGLMFVQDDHPLQRLSDAHEKLLKRREEERADAEAEEEEEA